MKKIIFIITLFLSTIYCYSNSVGDLLKYHAVGYKFSKVTTFLTKVEPLFKDGYYNIEITSIISPASGDSVIGTFTITSCYTVKENDKISLYYDNVFTLEKIILVVTKISNNEIELKTLNEILKEE